TSFRRARLAAPDPGLALPASARWSLSFLAPEQLAGGRTPPERKCDIYALGAIIYTLLTGAPPFLAQTVEATRMRVLSEAPVFPRALAEASEELRSICLACLAKNPQVRPATAFAVAEACRRVS